MPDATLNQVFEGEAFQRAIGRDAENPKHVPFRLKIQQGLTRALKQVDDANGFGVTVRTVGRGRLAYGDDSILPLVAVLEEPFSLEENLQPEATLSSSQPYEVIIQGFDAVKWDDMGTPNLDDDDVDELHPTDGAHILLAAVKARLALLKLDERGRFGSGRGVFRFGTKHNSIVGMFWDGGVVRPPEEVGSTANFWLRVRFDLSEDLARPTD